MILNPISAQNFKIMNMEFVVDVEGDSIEIDTRFFIERINQTAVLILDELFEGPSAAYIDYKRVSQFHPNAHTLTVKKTPQSHRFFIIASTSIKSDQNIDHSEVLRVIAESKPRDHYTVTVFTFESKDSSILPYGRINRRGSIENGSSLTRWEGKSEPIEHSPLDTETDQSLKTLLNASSDEVLDSSAFELLHTTLMNQETLSKEAISFLQNCLASQKLSAKAKLHLLNLPSETTRQYREKLAHAIAYDLRKLDLTLKPFDDLIDNKLQHACSRHLFLSNPNWAQILNVQYSVAKSTAERKTILEILASKDNEYIQRIATSLTTR